MRAGRRRLLKPRPPFFPVPTGRGLLTFNTMEEAVAGVEQVNSDYNAHCGAAREIAEEYLDYRKVLPKMLEDLHRR